MDDKHIIKGSRAQLTKSMKEDYGRVGSVKAANQNHTTVDRANAKNLAALIRSFYRKNKKKSTSSNKKYEE
jgi:hypothetical protein